MDNKLRLCIIALAMCFALSVKAQRKDYPIQGVTFTQVKLEDKFWLPRIETNHTVTIRASFERCEETGRVKNFEMAAAHDGKFCTVYPFDDTDIYKTIEGASFSMSLYPDRALDLYIDTLIAKVAAAQEPDGYLYTARTINPATPHHWAGPERWVKERELSHELYNSGHLFEAAAAHYLATGKRNLLDIAIRNADLVCSVFGHEKKHVAPGHQVVEMGLVKLYRITGKKEYLETAKYFLEERGHFTGYDPKSRDPWKNGSYWQDHIPVVKQEEATGHAVRAGYQYAAMADIAALTGDTAFLKAVDKLWENVVTKKIYVTGGVGAIGDGERFGDNYYLPNASAYNETCAAIANVYWNHRMFMLHGDAKYIDVLEKTLYNGLISGVGMDGKSFFYTNVLEVRKSFDEDQENTRSGWFPCSCCPTNVTRLIPSIPGYMYAQENDRLYVNLFATSKSKVVINKRNVEVIQQNNYPWDGDLSFILNPASALPFTMMVRIPGWARQQAIPSDLYAFEKPSSSKVVITVNGKPFAYAEEKGYALLKRTWKRGDVVKVILPLDVQRVVASSNVKQDAGRVSLQRGPLMYCAEWPDNGGRTANIILPKESVLKVVSKPDLLNGILILEGDALKLQISDDGNKVTTASQSFTAIPYYAWAHRGKGEMTVWFPEKVTDLEIISK